MYGGLRRGIFCAPRAAAALLLAAVAAASSADPGPVGCEKIRDTGADSNRLVIVIAGDGYTKNDLQAGAFAEHAEAFLQALAATPPWDAMLPAANVYRTDIASNESGADYEDASPSAGGTPKDTYLNAQFWRLGHEDLLAIDLEGEARARAAADGCAGREAWDLLAVIVNSTKYGGGSGNDILVGSAHPLSAHILMHEAAHTFVGLGDEYYTTTNRYRGPDPLKPNLDTNAVAPRWSAWVEPGTPLPTPDTTDYANAVGAFEGGGTLYKFGIYRPARTCKMRSLSASFCPVCREAHLLKLLGIVPLVESASPPADARIELDAQAAISMVLPPLGQLAVAWAVDGRAIEGETSATLLLAARHVASPTATVSATVSYASPAVRSAAVQTTLAWSVASLATTDRGVPQWWLARHGIDPQADGDLYDEGDGVPAWAEYVAGTDPSDAGSVFAAEDIRPPADGSVVLRWRSAADRTYAILGTADLAGAASAAPLAAGIPATPPLNTHTVDVTGADALFLAIAPDGP